MRRGLIALFSWLWLSAGALANVPCTLPFNLQNATTADATQVMANYNALVTCLGSAAASGANSDITALLGLTTPVPYTAGGSSVYIGGTSTGSANAQVVFNPTPNGFSLTAGKSIIFIAGFTNVTGSATQFNVNGTGLVNVAHPVPGGTGSELLSGGEITAGSLVQAFYDGTQYIILSVTNQLGGAGPVTTIASASTTNIANAVNHNASVTGTTPITSFGATASLNVPIYRVTFTGALTITYNQTSCSTVGGCILTPGGANITTAANDTAVLQYLGNGSGGGGNWQVIEYTRANGTAVVNPTPLCGATGFSLTNNAGTPDTSIDLAAAAAVLINPTGNVPFYTTSLSVTLNLTVNGAVNRLDTGALAASRWYFFYIISDGTTVGALASLSATTPTMPSGYIYQCRLGAMRTDGSVHFHRSKTLGSALQYVVSAATTTALPVIISGSSGSIATPTWTGTTVTGTGAQVCPSTATRIKVVLSSAPNNGLTTAIVAPNNVYGAPGSANPPPMELETNSVGGSVNNAQSAMGEFLLESNTLYYASNTSSTQLQALGCTDAVNAN